MSEIYNNYKEGSSLHILVNEIERALASNLYLTALISALAIPSLMATIMYGDSTKKNYIKWIDECVKNDFGVLYGKNKYLGVNNSSDESDKYLSSPTCICGLNCYQLRCSLLHDGTNEIKHDGRTKSNKYLWIDECVLIFSEEEFATGNLSGGDCRLEELKDGTIVTMVDKYCYISVRMLCNDIIRAAKECVNDENIKEKLPKIKITTGGGRIPNLMNPEIAMNNYRLMRKLCNKPKATK